MPLKQTDVAFLQGYDTLAFIRKLKDAGTTRGQLIPYQTSLSFDPQRDVDTNQTKSGVVPTTSALETDFETEFINNISKVSDWIYDSLMDEEELEVWVVYRKRVNDDGKRFAWYMRGKVTEDSNDNDPDDNSTRDATFTIDGKPQRGWLSLPDEVEEEIAYVFRGLGVIEGDPKNDGTDGDGTAWDKDKDAGAGVNPDQAKKTPGVQRRVTSFMSPMK